MKLSSYQILKARKVAAETEAQLILDDLEAVILQPYSSRAKNVRNEIKIKNDI
tara:strand:+ start:1698 stop:1856 length:159 start_codon:yes stop_codon:yes gene_type:complete